MRIDDTNPELALFQPEGGEPAYLTDFDMRDGETLEGILFLLDHPVNPTKATKSRGTLHAQGGGFLFVPYSAKH